MSIAFHSRIACIAVSVKNERITPKESKITLLGLDAKGNKNQKIRNKYPEIFLQVFQGKKELFKSDHQKYGHGGDTRYL